MRALTDCKIRVKKCFSQRKLTRNTLQALGKMSYPMDAMGTGIFSYLPVRYILFSACFTRDRELPNSY